MDPYLEGHLWKDVHQNFQNYLRLQLNPQILPKYIAVVESYLRIDDNPEADYGGMYPDMGAGYGFMINYDQDAPPPPIIKTK